MVVRQQLEPASGAVHDGQFGSAVAISGNGKTLLVGAPGHGGSGGAVWTFTHTATGWGTQGKLVVANGPRPACLGASVALSGDGSTAVAGDPCFDGNRGAVWAFVRSGSAWRQLGDRLRGSGERGATNFGAAVALSGDGGVVLVGGPNDDLNTGAAWVFRRKGSKWLQEGPKLRGRGEVGPGQLGTSVALSADGTIALLGGPSDDNSKGTAWVFAHTGSRWAEQGGKLSAKGGSANDEFGFSVALSGSGRVALVGSPSAGEWGQAMLFAPEGGAWREQQRLALDGKGAFGLTGGYGVSVALSSSGSTALVGSGLHNTDAAAATLFSRDGAGWSSRGLTLSTARAINEVTVALSGAGTTPVVGSPSAFANTGAAWAFSFVNVTPPTFSGTPGTTTSTGPLTA